MPCCTRWCGCIRRMGVEVDLYQSDPDRGDRWEWIISEALPLLDSLLEHSTQEAFQYRHEWRPGDLVLWDNRCLLHKANGDYDMEQTRYLYRLMLQGDMPR